MNLKSLCTLFYLDGFLLTLAVGVQDSGVQQDEAYKNKLIAATGCSGDLEFAFKTLEGLRASADLTVSPDTASATIRACVTCGQPTQALTVYKQFIACLLYTSPSPRDQRGSRMPSSA